MKRYSANIIRFLGGAPLAAALLFLAALSVAYGTFIESKTGSHQSAMESVYSSLAFRFLLGGFFINILVSALRRYPFKLSHIPFLVTHLGLLLIITGLAIKSFFGIQGMLTSRAGSETNAVIIPEEMELVISMKEEEGSKSFRTALRKDFLGRFSLDALPAPFSVRLLDYRAHSRMHMDTLFKGGFLDIQGLRPMPFVEWEGSQPLPLSGKVQMHSGRNGVVDVIAVEAEELSEMLEKALQGAELAVYLYGNEAPAFKGPMQQALIHGIHEEDLDAEIELAEDAASFTLVSKSDRGSTRVSFDLLKNELKSPSVAKRLSREKAIRKVTLSTSPKLIVLKKKDGAVEVAYLGADCRLFSSSIGPECEGARFISYEDGFQGYSIELPLPSFLLHESMEDHKLAALFFAAERLNSLPPHLLPLAVFSEGKPEKHDLAAEHLALFLTALHDEGAYLYQGSIPLPQKVRIALSESLFFEKRPELTRALSLVALLTDQATRKFPEAPNLKSAFLKAEIPLFKSTDDEDDPLFLGKVMEAALSLDAESQALFPLLKMSSQDPVYKEKLLSLLVRLYALSLEDVVPDGSFSKEEYLERRKLFAKLAFHFPPVADLPFREGVQALVKVRENEGSHVLKSLLKDMEYLPFYSKELLAMSDPGEIEKIAAASDSSTPYLESKVAFRYEPLPAEGVKNEERTPLFLMEIGWMDKKERLALAGKRGGALQHPLFDGQIKLEISPKVHEIPYLVRIQDARELSYPGSAQAKAYEATLYLQDVRSGAVLRKEIGLNRVFETDDGYRFFLSSILHGDESDVQEVRLAVNHDPSRRIFVFLGSSLVALGIVLLYLFSVRKKMGSQ